MWERIEYGVEGEGMTRRKEESLYIKADQQRMKLREEGEVVISSVSARHRNSGLRQVWCFGRESSQTLEHGTLRRKYESACGGGRGE